MTGAAKNKMCTRGEWCQVECSCVSAAASWLGNRRLLRRTVCSAASAPVWSGRAMGRSQVVRQRILIPPSPGSNPGAPATVDVGHIAASRVWQSEEEFPLQVAPGADCELAPSMTDNFATPVGLAARMTTHRPSASSFLLTLHFRVD